MNETSKERIMPDEAERMIKELSEEYKADGLTKEESRAMAISDLRLDYEW